VEAGSEQDARDSVAAMCEKLLRNPVIEDYRIDTVRATVAEHV
jgi:phosphoribosylformylglycinamidine (FGAM) synthase PurS component